MQETGPVAGEEGTRECVDLTEELAEVVKSGASNLKRGPRRRFMAGFFVRLLGQGGQRLAEEVLGWNRSTVRKGETELRTGVEIADGRADNGQPALEERFPTLLQDLRDIVEPFVEIDPTLRTERIYRKLTVPEVRRRLVSDKGYSEQTLPCEEPIRQRLNKLGRTGCCNIQISFPIGPRVTTEWRASSCWWP